MTVDSDPAKKQIFVRTLAAVSVLFLAGLWLWETRGDWHLSVPGFLLASVFGWAGAEAYRFVVGRGRGESIREAGITGWFFAAGATVTVVVGSVAWVSGDWREGHTVMGSLIAGAGTASWLVFLRLAIRGAPDRDG